MKRILLLAMMVLPLIAMACTDHDEVIISADKLPAKVQTYIKAHFPSCNILQATKERELGGPEYTVWLSEGYKLEFRKSEVTEIKGSSKLPDDVIPAKILEHVAANYAGLHILEWKLDDLVTQEVKLNNGLELVYSAGGDFLRIDH